MKKRVGWLILIALIASMIAPLNIYAENNNSLSQNEQEALEILQVLGIVSEEYGDLTLDRSKEVSRADFAVYLRKFINLEETNGTKLYYNDVSKNHYAYNDITLLTEYGYLNGVGNNLFAPEEKMNKENAYSVFLNLLGYNLYAQQNGIIEAARYAELTDGISASKELTIGDLFLIMYNAFLADCFEIDTLGTKSTTYTKGDTTYLYQTRRMMYFSKGTVTGVHGASIYNDNLNENQMIIDGEYIELDDKDYFDYLGMKVHYIVYFPYDDSGNQLVWIGEGSSKDIVNLEVDEDSYFDNNILLYDDGSNHTKKYTISGKVTVIYNGDFYSGNTNDIFTKDKYELRLLSLNEKNDIAIVWSYQDIIVSGRNSADMEIFDKLTNQYYNFDPDEYERFSLNMSTGETVEFEDLEDGDVISIFESQNREYMKAVACRNKVSGDITGRYDEKIEVDSKYYEYYDSTRSINTGAKSIELYLDYKGYIADSSASFVSSNRFVAYAYGMYYDDSLDSCIVIKILNENGTLETLYSKEKFNFNGIKKHSSDVFNTIEKGSDGRIKPQLVLLQKNSEGKVTALYTSSENGGNGELIKHQEMTGQNVWACQAAAEQGIIGVSMLYDQNTKVFNVPADAEVRDAKPSKFTVTSVKDNAKYQNAVSYKVTTDDIFYEQYIVNKAALSVDLAENEKIVQVKGMKKALNADDEVVDQLEIVAGGALISEYCISDDCEFSDICQSNTVIADLKNGDIVRVALKDEEIVKIELIYKHNQTGHFFYGDGGWGLGQFGLIYGECKLRIFSCTVTAKQGSAFKCDTGYTGSDKKQQVLNLAKDNSIIVIYDGKYFTKGTYNDISVGDFVVVQTHYNDNIAVVVYKQ